MSLKISQIRIDGGTQSRASIHETTVAEYAEAMADPNTVFPPVIVYFDGKEYWLADGFHRLAAWERIGREDIPVEIRQGDRRRAILHSVAANSAHGLRRTNEDKRRAVLTLLEDEEWGQWTQAKIAETCRVSREFVSRLKSVTCDPITSETGPVLRKYVNKHGQVGVMNVANIGRQSKPDQEGIIPEPQETLNKTEERLGEEIARSKPDQEPDPHAAARKGLSGLTREGLEDEVIGLREALAEARAKIKSLAAEIEPLKAENKALRESDGGRTLGNALRKASSAEGRMREHQAAAARLQRQVNAQKAEIAKLRAELEAQVIPL